MPQWYEREPIFNAELLAMHAFKDDARYGFLNDGRMYWNLVVTPRDDCGNVMRKWQFMLVYEPDHPHGGRSVKAYPVHPSIDEMQRIIDASPVTPKRLPPHLLRGPNGLYLCTCEPSVLMDGDNDEGVITTAATHARYAIRWINVFEAGLRSQEIWNMFMEHGRI